MSISTKILWGYTILCLGLLYLFGIRHETQNALLTMIIYNALFGIHNVFYFLLTRKFTFLVGIAFLYAIPLFIVNFLGYPEGGIVQFDITYTASFVAFMFANLVFWGFKKMGRLPGFDC